MLTKTYEIVKGPRPPTAEAYARYARREWKALLESNPSEPAMQSFLERHPMFLPGALTPGTRSGHAPLHFAAIAQPRLPGLRTKIPDFMWIAKHSAAWYPTLIEIERPSKRIFKANGVPTAHFTQARDQLADWRTWFSKPENVQQFIAAYGIPDSFRLGRQMQLHMILLYGRRGEFIDNPHRSEKRAALLPGNDEELVSYDRLAVDSTLMDAVTVRAVNPGKYEAIAVPPTFTLGPAFAERLSAIDSIERCLGDTPLVSAARRKFLISRLPYWREWGRHGKGMIRSGDHE